MEGGRQLIIHGTPWQTDIGGLVRAPSAGMR